MTAGSTLLDALPGCHNLIKDIASLAYCTFKSAGRANLDEKKANLVIIYYRFVNLL
jgi:hypothetical protein